MSRHDANKPATQATNDASGSWVEHPATIRRLQIVVVVLGVVLLAGFATVIARIAYMVSASGSSEAAAPALSSAAPERPPALVTTGGASADAATIDLPPGAQVESVAPMGSHLMVHYQDARGGGVLVYDPATGETVRRIRFNAN